MPTRESVAFARMKRSILLPGDRIDRVENGVVEGMFDVNYCIAGKEGWIEMKAPIIPKRVDTQLLGGGHPILQSQANWALTQTKAFGRCFLYVATTRACMLLPGFMVVNHNETNKMSFAELSSHAIWIGVGRVIKPADWDRLRRSLAR